MLGFLINNFSNNALLTTASEINELKFVLLCTCLEKCLYEIKIEILIFRDSLGNLNVLPLFENCVIVSRPNVF